jgi:tetratricopeptide (TPR) repeat protein
VLTEKWPESEPAPGAYFKIFDIYKERKDYANCRKLMEEFVQKYPDHENVYYAFNNIAEFLFTGVLNPKMGADGKPLAVGLPSLEDTEAGAKKLYEYVDYELSKDLKTKRGDGSLLKVADKWMERLAKLPPYTTQNNDQKLIWERSVEGIVVAIEKMLKSYPSGDKVSDGLDRLVTAQKEMLKARVIDAEKGVGYFRKLANEASSADLKARLLFALGAFVQDTDAKKAAAARADGYASAGKVAAPAGGERPAPIFGAADWDRYLNDLFDARKFEDIAKGVARIRSEYKEETGEGAETPMPVQNALAVALFWEAKVLGEQGKAVEAGNLYSQLAKKYPKSTKVFEADYGIIYGQVEAGTSSDPTFLPRLTKIVNNVRDVKTFELPAKALYLIGRIQERERDYEAAVATYLKIHTRYESVPDVAGDGLWAGAQLLEKQAAGTIPVRTQKELAAAAAAKAAKAKAQKEKEDAEKKKAEGQSKTDPKATDAKPADPKAPGVAKTAPATAQK